MGGGVAYLRAMRLFIAIEVPDEVRTAARNLIEQLKKSAPDAKWVSPDKMHLTLAFLGEVSEDAVEAVQHAIEMTARAHLAFDLRMRGGGGFGGRRHPRVLWLGTEGDVDRLAAVQATLVQNLVPTGFEPDSRPFKAHLTLARAREQRGDPELARAAERLAAVDFGGFHVDRLVLIHSETGPKGSKYTPLFYAALKKHS